MTAPALPLADIHLPAPVSIWPPAYGWWLLATLILVILYLTVRAVKKWRKQRVQRDLALAELVTIDLQHHGAWQQINTTLKRAAMVYYSREQVAALTGINWKKFLLQCVANKKASKKLPAFDDNWLQFAYAASIQQQSIEQFYQFAQLWLKYALPADGKTAKKPQGAQA